MALVPTSCPYAPTLVVLSFFKPIIFDSAALPLISFMRPSFGLIRRAKEATMLPINVMIRPHSRSFVYDEQDIQVMLQDIDKCK